MSQVSGAAPDKVEDLIFGPSPLLVFAFFVAMAAVFSTVVASVPQEEETRALARLEEQALTTGSITSGLRGTLDPLSERP